MKGLTGGGGGVGVGIGASALKAAAGGGEKPLVGKGESPVAHGIQAVHQIIKCMHVIMALCNFTCMHALNPKP